MGRGASRVRQNAMRSGLIVIGAAAFGYLSLQVGFKPYLERAQEAMGRSDPAGSDGDGQANDERLGGEWSSAADGSSVILSSGEEVVEVGKWRMESGNGPSMVTQVTRNFRV